MQSIKVLICIKLSTIKCKQTEQNDQVSLVEQSRSGVFSFVNPKISQNFQGNNKLQLNW